MKSFEIVAKINQAIIFLKREVRPLPATVHERTVAHRLAVHMENLFAGWDIDCEYNKHGDLMKELHGVKECDSQRKTERILPDIIVHERKQPHSQMEKNLLVIEMKRGNSCDMCDKRKLELFTEPGGKFEYQFGLYINLEAGEYIKTWYANGKMTTEDELAKTK